MTIAMLPPSPQSLRGYNPLKKILSLPSPLYRPQSSPQNPHHSHTRRLFRHIIQNLTQARTKPGRPRPSPTPSEILSPLERPASDALVAVAAEREEVVEGGGVDGICTIGDVDGAVVIVEWGLVAVQLNMTDSICVPDNSMHVDGSSAP